MDSRINYAGKMAVIANQYKKEKEYWLQKMSGTLVKSYFPYDFFISDQHNQDNGKGFDTLGLEFSPEFFLRLMEISKGSDYALYIILVSGLVSILYKYTGNKDIIVGAPIFKQAKEGKFINTVLAVCSRIEAAMTFKQLLTQVKESVLEADANINFPIEILLNQLDIPYTGNDDFPLFDMMILLENIQEKNYISDINVNLKFYFRLKEKNIDGTVEYKPGRYRKETVQTVIAHYINLLEQALSNPHQPLSALDILAHQERERILYTFNNTAAGYPQDKTLHRLIAEQVERKPDQIAVLDRVKGKEDHRQSDTTDALKTSPIQITYRELKEKSIPLEYTLRQKGVEPDIIVGIMVERSIEMLTGILAILNAGGAYLPIDTDYPPARIEYMLADSGVKILLGKLNKLSKLTQLNESIETIEIPGDNEDLPTQPTQPTQLTRPTRFTRPYHLAYVIYTSGSTGRPKGMLIRHNNVVRLMVNDKNLFAFSSSDVWTLFHSYCFDFSVWEIFGALLYGGKLVIIKKMTAKDPVRFLKILKQEKVTVLNQTPQAFYNLIDAELKYETKELNLDYVIFGGEALKPVKLKSWREKYPGVKLINMYGITETTVHVTYKEIKEHEIHLNISSIGNPIPTTTTYVMDQGLNLLPIGVSGELFVGGDGVGRGYLNRPELTYEKFLPNPYKPWEILYRTGDRVKLSHNGEMEYLGRIDHQVKIRGYRIEVEEIESHLLKHKDIKEAAVLSRENKDGSKYLCAYVTAVNNNKEAGEVLANNLREFLLQKLPDYMIPSYFIRLDQFPLTVNGKLDRKALPEPDVDLETRYKAPTNEIQEKMAEAWQQVLGHEKIGISNNFFKAGGDSIKAITLITKLNDSLHADLVVVDLYNYQTIEELSEQLVKNRIHYPDHDEFLEEARKDIQEFKKRFIEHNKMTDEIEDVYPMSDIEKGMVYHYLNDPQGAFYFEQNAYKVIYKDFNIGAFKQALTLMVKKHPILRTGFDVDDFAHVIYKNVSPVVSDYDISSMTEQEQRTYVLNYMEKSRKVMFPRLTPPLWRMAFFKPGNEYVIILMELHHAMLDGWSLSLFLTELERIYLQLKSQKQVNPGKLKCSYKEFITSETAVKKRIAAREYWKNELSGYKRFTFPPTGQEGKEYKEIEINSGGERLEQLQMTAAKHNTSLKHLCFAAYVYALGMFSYEDDIVLGLITNSRPICEDGDRLLGCFLNTIPVRMAIPTRIKWHEYIKQIDEKMIEIKKYDMMPFNEIVKIIEEKSGDQNPIFDCIFNYIDFYAYQGIQPENALVDTSVGSYIKTNTFLGLDVDVSLKTFRVFCDYSTSFISKTYCKKLCAYFQEVLNKFIDEPEGYAIKSAIIPEREKHKILFEFNNTGAEYPEEKTIHGLFTEQVERTPDHMALVGKGESWQGRRVESKKENISITYRELHQKSGQLAHLLMEKGIVADTIVGIISQRSVEMIIGILGILKAGGAYLPIDPEYPPERIDFMLKDSGAKILLSAGHHHDHLSSRFPSFSHLSIFPASQLPSFSQLPNFPAFLPSSLAYIIYTSGSTGKPKGVMVDHQNVVGYVNAFLREFKLTANDTMMQQASSAFDAFVEEVFPILTRGGKLAILKKDEILDMQLLSEFILRNKVSIISCSPLLLNELNRISGFKGVTTFISGGDELKAEYVDNIVKRATVYNTYGPTETTVCATYYQYSISTLPGAPITPGITGINIPIGQPISNYKVYILDKSNQLIPMGVAGEICVSGVGVARGYLNRPELTAEKFTNTNSSHSSLAISPLSTINQWPMTNGRLYRTGDLARWLPDGNIEFLGRLDFQVKIRGNRIELGEIEKQLLNYQNIKEAVVTARKGQKGNGYLCAYIIPTSMDSAEFLDARNMFKLSGIREYLSRYLPDYMIPAHFVVLPGLPLTASGKLDRHRLPEPEGIDLEPDTKYIAPRDEIEKSLVDILQQVLGKNIIGIHDNFFELGGDSIKAIQIASRMHKAGYKIEIRDIFQQRRISDMAALVKKIERIADQSIITGTISLTPIQKWFFNNHPVDTHHFNQAMMLYIEPGEEFPDQLVRTLFSKLQEHHDALRMSYKEIDGKIIQTNHGLEYPLSLAEYDFRGCGSAVQMLEQKADELQASIDLEKGPLMKLGLFHLDDGHRLLMVIHHLVIDGVSWRILFEDLETLYMQYRRGEELTLPLKTDSFKTWSEKLHEYANDQPFLKEKLYWQNLAAHDLPVIKKDFPVETDYLKDKNALSFTLNEEETSFLLTKANVAFGTEISDLLLTALGLGLKETFAIQRILIALEGHGREEIIKDVDITRTVGWFTSLYPVLLNFSYENDLSRQIKDIKENLHRVPNKGIGYGILKYLTGEEVSGDIDLTLKPQICFNYLGQFDTDIKQFSSFQPAKESPGNTQGLKGKQEYLFVVTGIIVNNCLELTIEYNKNHFKLETIEKLLHCCQVNLQQVIAFCLDRETSELTPSDLDYQEFTIDELGNLFEQIIIGRGREIRLTKDNISNIYTLSPMQEGMYFYYLYDKSSPAYFIQFSYRINGDLHVQLMEKSLNELFKRYDILRTVFMHKKGKKLFQVVLKESRIDFHYENISAAADKEDYLAKFKKNDRKRSFDLGKDVLMRASLIQLDKFEYEFTLSFHHILMDGWCVSIIIAELAEIYNSYLERRPYRLPEAKQYRIYIKWLESQDREAARGYWEKYLRHYEDTASIPGLGKNNNNYRNENYTVEWEQEKTKKLEKMAVKYQVTLNTIFQSAWGILLGKYNGKQDVVFGAVVSGRPAEIRDVESMIGLFINTIPVRIQYEEQSKFVRLLKHAQEKTVACDSYSYYPLAQIQALTKLKQNLFDHIIAFENYPVAEQIDNLMTGNREWNFKVSNVEIFEQTTYDFNIQVGLGQRLTINFLYNANSAGNNLIRRVANHLVRILDQVIDNEEVIIERLSFLSETEKNMILYEINDTTAGYPANKTIHELFAEQVTKTLDNTALILGNEQLTYHQLDKNALQWARILRDNGAAEDHIIGLILERSLEMIIVIMAVLKAGGAYLPIDPNYPPNRITFMLKDSQVELIVSRRTRVNHVSLPARTIYLEDKLTYTPGTANLQSISHPHSMAYIIYTSGTTGKPKGVIVENRNVVRLMMNDRFQFDFNSHDTWTLFHSYGFDFSVWEMYGALLYGGKLVIVREMVAKDPARFLVLLKKWGVTVLNQTPSAFYNLQDEELKTGTRHLHLKYVIFGGEALKPVKLKQWKEKYPGTRLINMFGITETTVHVTYKEITEKEISLSQSNIGRPIPTLRLYIMDKNHHVLPVGVSGELCVGGLGPARGYLNRIELSGMKFVPNPYISGDKLYKSGDLGRLLDNGDIEYLGRIDNQMQLRGFRIELGEIENQLLGYKDIKECVVLVKENEDEHQYLCAYIVPGKQIVSSKLRDYLSKRLPSHMIPNYFVPIEKIPLTLNGKVNRDALPEPLTILEKQDAPPRNEIEEKLLQIWEKELAVDNISIKDSFFNLGGDSIKAIGLLSVINKALNSNLKIEDIFINNTIEELSGRISAAAREKYVKEREAAVTGIEELKKRILSEGKLNKLNGKIEDIYPMSDIQIGMIYYADKYLDKAMYFEQFTFQTKIPHFELDTFKRALNLITDRQTMLRTGFNLKDFEQPVQIVYKNAEIDVKYRDISDKSIEDQEKYITQFMENERQNPFIISMPPLLKVVVFESFEENFIFMWEFHHVIGDGWSFASFITEVNNTYLTLKLDPYFIPGKLKCSYKDFVIEQIAEKTNKAVVEFWKNELDSYKRFDFSLLKDGKNSTAAAYTKKTYSRSLEKSFSQNLQKAARENDISLKNICFAAYAYMLQVVSYENDFVTGLISHNRPAREDSEKIFGCFLNTIPVRIKIPPNLTWREYIRFFDQKIIQLIKYERLSFFEICRIIGETSREENPLFDTIFSFMNFHVYEQLIKDEQENQRQDDDTDRLVLGKHENTNTLFDFVVVTSAGNFKIDMIYSDEIFSDEQVDRLFGYFKSILTNILTRPGHMIKKDELISREEKEKLLYQFNDTGSEYPGNKTIHQLFAEQANQTPDPIAVQGPSPGSIHGASLQLTYRELNEESQRLALAIIPAGVEPDSIVGIMAERSMEMVIGILGILKAGGAYLPIDPGYPQERINFILKDSGTKILLSTNKIRELLEAKHLPSPANQKALHLEMNGYAKVSPGNTAYVIYTSGTTGNPKGVIVEHRGVVDYIWWAAKTYVKGEKLNFPLYTSISFDLTVTSIFTPLITGNAIILYAGEKGEFLLDKIIHENRAGIVKVTPSLLKLIPGKKIAGCSLLKCFIVGGEELQTQLAGDVSRVFQEKVEIYNEYGPTETVVGSTLHRFSPGIDKKQTVGIGKPTDNTLIYILDVNRNMQPIGVRGEIYIGGPDLARGYLNRPELTAEKFVLNFLEPGNRIYRTGDLGRWLPDGNIEFSGRIDNQVKIRGFRIELGEIENRLLKYEKLKEAVVILKEDKSGDRFLCAYITSNGEISTARLRTYLKDNLPGYMIPAHFIKLDKLPLTLNGKIDRKALPGLAAISEIVYAAPRDAVENELAAIWAQVLGIEKEKISIDANFFEIGGHSLKAVVLIAKIHKAFDIKLQLSELFKKPTIRELTVHIKGGTVNQYRSLEFAELKEYYPLSSPQKRLFILHQFDRESTGYNMAVIFQLEGKIHKQEFEKTFIRLIERHESLRTSFALVGNESVQVIHGDSAFNLEYFQGPPEPIIKDFIRSFDLAKVPLIRVGLIRTAADRHVFIVDMHHIIADGVSLGIMVRDFMSIYTGERLTPLKLQYKEYSQWQNRELKKGEIAKQENYWLEQFEGGIPVLELPTDFNRPPVQSFAGNSVSFEIDEEQRGGLNRLAMEMGCTLYMVLIALYSIFLAKISNQEDIVIGSPTAGRNHADLESIIGIFLNTLPLRTGPESSKTFAGYVSNLKETILTAFENQDYPYEDLVKNVSVDRDMSRNPLFDVMFILQSMDTGIFEIPGLKILPYQYENTSAKFDLTLIAREEEEKIYFTLEYCTALFRDATARGFVQYFKNTLDAALQDPGIKIAGIEIVTPGEKKRILLDFNKTRKEYPGEKTIHQLFAEQASIIPDKIALVFENAHLTYKGLQEKVNSLARLLKSKGVAPNRVVGLSMERSLEMITGIYGILEAGGAYLPCDPNYPEKRVKYMFEKSETRLLLSRGGLVAQYRDMPVRGEVLDIDASYAPNADKNRIPYIHINHSHDLAYLIFTSGSTGNPKGIMIEHKSVVNFIEGTADIIDFSHGKTILAVTTISFDIFVLETLLPLAKGLKVVIAAERHQDDPDLLSDIILKNKVNMVQLTPSRLKMLTAVNRLDCLKEVRELMVGGEAFPGDLLACLQKSFKGKIFNMYGPTETTVWSTVKELTLSAEINIGTPIANTYVYILDKNHHLQPIGITGELGIGGAGTARGYLNNPELTADKFEHDLWNLQDNRDGYHRSYKSYKSYILYKTGDMARWLPDGDIDFLGRLDEQVKIRGFRIESGEIEGLLLKREGIKEVVVTSKDDSMGNKCLCAYYISDLELSVSDLRKYCSGTLPEYMIPSYFMRMEKFPLTPNGKIHRKLLPNPEIKTGAAAAAPRNETEKKLVEIWSGVLAVQAEQVSIDSNFFELGGHSLSAVILISIIHKELTVKVPLSVFFKKPNIRDLSQSISEMAKEIYISITPAEKREYYPLSSAQMRLYVIQQMEPGNLVYNFPQTFTWEGPLHREKLEQSFKRLIRRHEGLRTSFLMVEEETYQRIYDETGFKIEYYELNGGDAGAVIKKFIRPFDLSKPPIRVGLVQIEKNKHLLMLDMHHIITDFVSNRVLVDDFAAIYEEEPLPALRLQYTDFSQWHNELLKSGQIKKQERYWLEVFKEEVPPLNLPTDFSPAGDSKGEGSDLAFALENEKYDMLNELRRQTGTTFFVLLLTIYYILLYKYTGKEDIVIANPTAGRYHPDLEGIIGVFINMLAMRNRPRGNKTFSEFIKEVKENTLTALENQDFQFDELVKKLGLQRNTKTNPLNDCVFNYIDVRTNEERKELSSEIKISPYGYERNVNPFNLLLIATVTEDMINMMLTYPSLLFKRTTMEKMAENYMDIIDQVSEDQEIRLADIKLSHDLFIVKSSVQRKEESDFNF